MVSPLNIIKHFCQLEDVIEHIEDKNGRSLKVKEIEEYCYHFALKWYPSFCQLYDHRLVTPKLHEFLHLLISTMVHGKQYETSSNPFEHKGGSSKKFIRGSYHAHLTNTRNLDIGIKVKLLINKETKITISDYRPKRKTLTKTDDSWVFVKLVTKQREIVYRYGNVMAFVTNGEQVGVYVNIFSVQGHIALRFR